MLEFVWFLSLTAAVLLGMVIDRHFTNKIISDLTNEVIAMRLDKVNRGRL